jgi:hypothetical protein
MASDDIDPSNWNAGIIHRALADGNPRCWREDGDAAGSVRPGSAEIRGVRPDAGPVKSSHADAGMN